MINWRGKVLNRQPACEDINRRETSQVQTQKRSQGAAEGCKVLNSPAPSDVVILVVFLPGEDLINAEKQTRSVQWRGCCEVRTVAHWTHPPVGRKRSCGKKANRSHGRVSLTPPWTRDPTIRLLPITSARHLAHIPQSAHAHAALCGSVWMGWRGASEGGGVLFMEGSKEWKLPCSQGNYKVRTLDGLCSLSRQGEKILGWSKRIS